MNDSATDSAGDNSNFRFGVDIVGCMIICGFAAYEVDADVDSDDLDLDLDLDLDVDLTLKLKVDDDDDDDET